MPGRPLDPTAVKLYRQLVDDRLRESSCPGCGTPLSGAAIAFEDSGSTLEDYPLGDTAQAHLLAATVRLGVTCASCGAEAVLGATPGAWQRPAQVLEAPALPWAREAVAIYHQGIRERLQGASCGCCGGSLREGQVLRTVGGTTLDDYALSDEGLARLLSATQHLWVSCPTCGKASEIG
jgi:hypothetical protein